MCLDKSSFHYFYRILIYLEIKPYSFNIVEINVIIYLMCNRFTLYYSLLYYTLDKMVQDFCTLQQWNLRTKKILAVLHASNIFSCDFGLVPHFVSFLQIDTYHVQHDICVEEQNLSTSFQRRWNLILLFIIFLGYLLLSATCILVLCIEKL